MNRRVFCALLIYLPSSYGINTFLRAPATTVLSQGAADAAAERLRLYRWCKITKLPLQKVGGFFDQISTGRCCISRALPLGAETAFKAGLTPRHRAVMRRTLV